METYIYYLKLNERYHIESNWDEFANKVVSDHFNYLLDLEEKGRIILVGKTNESDDLTFGIVIFKAENFEVANQIATNDPAVINNIMNVTVHPFNIVLHNEKKSKKN